MPQRNKKRSRTTVGATMPNQSTAARIAAGSTAEGPPQGPTLGTTVEGAVRPVTAAEVALMRSWVGDLLAGS